MGLLAYLWIPAFTIEGSVSPWILAVAFAVLLSLATLIHEFAHALVARALGFRSWLGASIALAFEDNLTDRLRYEITWVLAREYDAAQFTRGNVQSRDGMDVDETMGRAVQLRHIPRAMLHQEARERAVLGGLPAWTMGDHKMR